MRFISNNIMPLYQEKAALGSSDAPLYTPPAGTQLFSLARESLGVVAKEYAAQAKRVVVPAFTCATVIRPFTQRGWSPAYYDIDENLRINSESFLEVLKNFRPDVVVVHPYCGQDLNGRELDLLKKAKEKGCFVVEDLTQSLFSARRYDFVDVYVGSVRKWFGIPDGSFYTSDKLQAPSMEELEENTDFVTRKKDAMYIRGMYFQNNDLRLKEISERLDGAVGIGGQKGVQAEFHRISDYSRRILAQEDFAGNNCRRMANARYLYERLKDSRHCKVVYKDISDITTGPLWFPFYLKDPVGFRETRLKPKGIEATRMWVPVADPAMVISETVRRQYYETLFLPCGQMFDEADMQRMVDAIEHV